MIEAQQVQNCWNLSCAWSTRSSISYNFHSSSKCFLVCKLYMCSLGTNFQALLFFISVVSFKFAALVFPLYSSFYAFVVVALLLGSHLVSPFQRQQSCGREQHSARAVHSP